MTDTTPRDKLAQIIERALRNMWDDTTEYAKDVADEIQEAGWRPPARVVTTVEEVEALADMTVVLESGRNWCFVSRKLGNNYWLADGIEDAFPSVDIGLPATVLYEPEEGE